MKRLKVNLFLCVVAAVLIALLLTTAVAQAAAWTVVPSPSPGVEGTIPPAVASVSANDVWAVGEATEATGRQLTLTEHWNGTAWSVVASPNVGSANNTLLAVAAVSTTDVWAVGKAEGPGGAQAPPLIEHWNGTSWSIVTAPRHVGVLNGITAVSTTDVWAVGDFLPAANVPEQTLILHWDGTSWSVVASPNVGSGFNVLFAAATVATNDVWAVGEFGTPSGLGTLIEQWNGSSWSVISSPSAGELRGIAIISATDIWAVGSVISSGVEQTLIEQWNGTTWSVVTSPNPSASENILGAAAADQSSGQAWAVGEFFNTTSNVLQTLTEFNP